jgi:ABC-type uncharacterized transport system permease subunit
MTPEALSIAALVAFSFAAFAAIAGFRIAKLHSPLVQGIPVALGVLLKTASIGLACAKSDTHFFNSPAEIAGLFGWALSCSFLVALLASAARSLGALILPMVVVLLTLSLVSSGESAGAPDIKSRFLAPHILSAFLGYGLFLTACGASILYLEQARLLKRKTFGVLFKDLPSLEKLERLEIFCSWLGLAAFSIALATGAMMASEANKPFWFVPKFLSAQVTWLIFTALVIGRAVRWLNGRTAAKFVLIGAGLVLFTFALGHPLSRPQTTSAVLDGTPQRSVSE